MAHLEGLSTGCPAMRPPKLGEENPRCPSTHPFLAEAYRATGQADLAAREERSARAAEGTTSSVPSPPPPAGPNR